MKKNIEVVNNTIKFNINELSEAGRRSLTSVPLNRSRKLSISPKAKLSIEKSRKELMEKFDIITD